MEPHRYQCPRCALRYCALHCYRKHPCAELFYKDQVKQHLSQEPQDKSKMRGILARVHKSGCVPLQYACTTCPNDCVCTRTSSVNELGLDNLDSDSEHAEHDHVSELHLTQDLHDTRADDRFENIDELDTQQLLGLLTVHERHAFARFVSSKDSLDLVIRPLEPWWLTPLAEIPASYSGSLPRIPLKLHVDFIHGVLDYVYCYVSCVRSSALLASQTPQFSLADFHRLTLIPPSSTFLYDRPTLFPLIKKSVDAGRTYQEIKLFVSDVFEILSRGYVMNVLGELCRCGDKKALLMMAVVKDKSENGGCELSIRMVGAVAAAMQALDEQTETEIRISAKEQISLI